MTAAFFDVDETLITVKSMFRFLGYFFREQGRPAGEAEEVRRDLGALTASGVPRAETNRLYYRQLAGHRVADVARIGREWFAAELAEGGLLHGPACERLAGHRRAGDLVVLVSGSFSACLEPAREHLGADLALGTEPAVEQGRYTGAVVGEPSIGPAKAAHVRRTLRQHGLTRETAWAYADHASDLELLQAVGHPVAVGADPVLAEAARAGNWPVLAGVTREAAQQPPPRTTAPAR